MDSFSIVKPPKDNLTKEQRKTLKELRSLDTFQKRAVEKSALAEHAWDRHHLIRWEETTSD